MSIELRLLDWSGNEVKTLPDVESLTLSPVHCDAGAIEFQYPKDGINWSAIRDLDEFPVAVYVDGVKQGRLQGIVKEMDGDDVAEAGVWKFTGFFNNGRLAEAVTYPKGWPSVNPEDPNQKYLSITVGALVKTLLQQAQARGTLSGMTHGSFNSTSDSNGQAWTSLVSIEYAPQVDYLTILQNLYEQGLCEFEVVGDDIRLYRMDTLAVDRTVGSSPLVFRAGRDLSDSPRKRSTRELGTVILASGAEGLYLERTDADAVASRRRIETSAGQGQVSDAGTLAIFADVSLSRVSQPKMEKTHGLSFGEDNTPRPIRDFAVGDWAYSDVGKGLERLRIKQWTLKLSPDGELSGSVVLNDLFADQDEQLSKRIKGIVGGSTITGGSAAERELPAELVDEIAPAAPVSLVLNSSAYVDNQGRTFANIAASWTQVTTNSDGTVLEDLAGYTVRWRYEALEGQGVEPWRYAAAVTDTSTTWSPVSPGMVVEAQVSAHDRAGNASPWIPTVPVSITAAADAVPPGIPSTPIVDNYLGLLRSRYDGKTSSGAAVASDQNIVEVHVSTTSGFTPDRSLNSTTRIDTLSAAGSSFFEGTYGVTYFFRFVAVDHSGNASAPSAQASAAASQVVSADVFDGAIGTAKIADLAITTAKINLLAVNSAQIGSLEVGKLTAGTMNVDVVVGGRFTTALTGLRVEMNSLGFQKFDASNNKLISLTGSEALLTGIFKTAISGRRIEIGAGGSAGRMEFYAPNGAKTEIGSFTGANVGVEVIRLGVVNDTISQFWNKMQIQDDGGIFTWSAFHHIVIGGGGAQTQDFAVLTTPDKGTPANPQFTETRRLHVDMDTFYVNDKLGNLRLWLHVNGSNYLYHDSGQSTNVVERQSNGDQAERVLIDDNLIRLRATALMLNGSNAAAFVELHDRFNVNTSPQLKFFTAYHNGNVYGAAIRYALDLANLTLPRMEVVNIASTGYEPIWAADFVVNSDGKGKRAIADIEGSSLEVVRKMRPRKFARKREDNIPEVETEGFIAQEMKKVAPGVVLDSQSGMAISMMPLVARLVGAVQELTTEFYEYKEAHP